MYRCTVCGRTVRGMEVASHKGQHPEHSGYGILWPTANHTPRTNAPWRVPTLRSPTLAKRLGVREVYVRDEGRTPSGSMKDYITRLAVSQAVRSRSHSITVTSSGNHAASLCYMTRETDLQAVMFVPSSSSKIPAILTHAHARVIAVKDSVFEEAYQVGNLLDAQGVYDANVRNESLLPAFVQIGNEIAALDPRPTHILAGVGNGTYLAGIALGLTQRKVSGTQIVPVGMSGAFPTHFAFLNNVSVWKQDDFHTPESLIDAAEGSIALESYSMPQLMYALEQAGGFTLHDLTNDDLATAYRVLSEDADLMGAGAIPEPTGIMSLAAALKWPDRFGSDAILHLAFTANGAKDIRGIERLVNGSTGKLLVDTACASRPDLLESTTASTTGRIARVPKNISARELNRIVEDITS